MYYAQALQVTVYQKCPCLNDQNKVIKIGIQQFSMYIRIPQSYSLCERYTKNCHTSPNVKTFPLPIRFITTFQT